MSVPPLNRLQIAWRAAQDITDGMLVNLGLGMPLFVADYLRPEVDVFIQSENGVIGVGALAPPDRVDTDLVDAGSRRITVRPGASFVDSSWSFAMIRGGHIDVAILGAFEVASNGDLANWDMRLPNKGPLVGGAMDLAACARSVWIMMEHVTRQGTPRLLDTLRAAAHRGALRQARLHRSRRRRHHPGRHGGAGDAWRSQRSGFAGAHRSAPLTFAPDCRPLKAPAIALPD